MYIDRIAIEGFRNFGMLDAAFARGINVITGGNAQGKTNLLEAMFYLSCAKSFRIRGDKDLVGFDYSFARIEADVSSQMRETNIEIRLYKDKRRQIFLNGVKQSSATELPTRLGIVLFCPEDLEIIRDGAAARRRFMDIAISQLRPKYAVALSEYNRLYEHKARILKDWREKPSLLEILDDFSLKMAKISAELIYYRSSWCEKLNEEAAKIHADISGVKEKLKLRYKTVSTVVDPSGKKPNDMLPCILRHQEEHRRAELDSGICLTGAHKDDIEIMIDGNEAKTFASQGQIRTAALSLKLAEREISCKDRGEMPVLLLDDVLSELDVKRQDFVLNHIGGGQVFISCCEDKSAMQRMGDKLFYMKSGVLCS
jgi:DNA replication and repair protein RecF